MTILLESTLNAIRPAGPEIYAQALGRHDTLTKPAGSLCRLEPLGAQLAASYGTPTPTITGKAIAVFAANHDNDDEGVSAYPQAVTAQMVINFLAGGAAINALAKVAGARLLIVDTGVKADLPDHPTLLERKVRWGARNFLHARALTEAEAMAAIEACIDTAIRQLDAGANLLAAGDMGIATTTTTGYYLAAAANRTPAILDGSITTAAALLATGFAPSTRHFLIASHASHEAAHRVQLEQLGLEPLPDLQLRLGEGSGAAVAMPLVEAAARVLAEMSTFEGASGSRGMGE